MAWGRRKQDATRSSATDQPEKAPAPVEAAPAVVEAGDVSIEVDLEEGEAASTLQRPRASVEPSTVVGEDMKIDGNLSTGSPVLVLGAIDGDVTSARDIEVRGDGQIQGTVRGHDVTVAGKIEGAVAASGRLLILKTGQVLGDVTVRSILIEEGGVLSGRCDMQGAR